MIDSLSLLLRARRKYASDGTAAVLSEALTTVLESKASRSVIRNAILDHAIVLEQSQLRERAHRYWSCVPPDSSNPFGTEASIPPKTRLPNSGSFDGLEQTCPPSPFVAELEDVTVLGPAGIGVTDQSELLKDTIAPRSDSDSRIEKVLARSVRHNGFRTTRDAVRSPSDRADRHVRTAASLIPVWNNYYHWTLECLPKLLGIETYHERTGELPTLLLPPDLSSWMRESLELVGDVDLVSRPLRSGTTRVDRFVVPSYPTPSRTECFWLRDRAHRAAGVETETIEELPSRIYVSRHNANIRRVRNAGAVHDVLEEFDIEPYALEELPVATQVRLFANADLVVSPHGAGLANLVYGTDPTVLELFGGKQKTTFYRLSKLMGFEYHALFCDHTCEDLLVDPDRLRTVIGDIIAGDRTPILPASSQ